VKDGIGREIAGQFGLRFRLPRKSQGSFTCRKSATWDRRLYFPSEGRHVVDFFTRKIRRLRPGSNPRSYLLTCLLTLWSRFLNEKLAVCQLVKKFPAFYGTRKFITAFTRARHLSLHHQNTKSNKVFCAVLSDCIPFFWQKTVFRIPAVRLGGRFANSFLEWEGSRVIYANASAVLFVLSPVAPTWL
jgi:hypothetical protein